jgi:hypothetical protein
VSGFSRTDTDELRAAIHPGRGRLGNISALATLMMGRFTSAAVLALVLVIPGCVVGGALKPTLEHPTDIDIASLWQEPTDLAERDLFLGPGGPELMPDSSTPFTFVAEDRAGYSAGYDVRGPDGMEWSVKLGPEAQTEVAVSRILWALGYHQPPSYYVATWTITGAQSGPREPGRFRPKLKDRKVVGEWSWYENDFINTQAFKGLVVANVMLNNWDWKTSNNKIYEISAAGQPVQRVYVVQDLGASLGKTSYPKVLAWLPMRGLGQGSRNDLEDFEAQGFIKRVDGERVEFFYRGIHQSLLDLLTTGDVEWVAERMGRLSDEQWHDAFRAAGYSDEHARRFVAKIKSKVDESLKLSEG